MVSLSDTCENWERFCFYWDLNTNVQLTLSGTYAYTCFKSPDTLDPLKSSWSDQSCARHTLIRFCKQFILVIDHDESNTRNLAKVHGAIKLMERSTCTILAKSPRIETLSLIYRWQEH